LDCPVPIGIVDYGVGNIASLEMAVIAVGGAPKLARNPSDLASVAAVILPGVGHFGPASVVLHDSGLAQELYRLAAAGLPLLGICLGFQLLTVASEEAPGASGLGMFPLYSQRLRPSNTLLHKVPHMGWNTLEVANSSSRLLDGIPLEQQSFYFSNAYAIAPDSQLLAIQATYRHERPWLALLENGPICGVQFHPEKSRGQGLKLLRNFLMLAVEFR
jgi:glutamine amidotransferase